jgi:DNA-binding transcriptional MerR regulator
MHTISALARRFSLSRSTLLYYDSIGVLAPTSRSRAGYRLYGDDAVRRLGIVCR